MTRKDYVLLANALKNAKPDSKENEAAHTTWHNTVMSLVVALKSDNASFKPAVFRAACGA